MAYSVHTRFDNSTRPSIRLPYLYLTYAFIYEYSTEILTIIRRKNISIRL